MALTGLPDYSVVADPYHYAEHGVPYEMFDALRARPGLTRLEPARAAPVWAVTRYDDIRHVGRNQTLFHNSPRNAIEQSPDESAIPGFENLLDMDPPKHGRYRKILAANFTVNLIRERAPVVGRYADRAFQALETHAREGEPFDLVEKVAGIVPTYTACALIGIPEEDAGRVTDWVKQLSAAADRSESVDVKRMRLATIFMQQVAPFFFRLLAQRRQSPEDDLISKLAANTDPELTDAEIISYCILLMAGGDDTTRQAFCGGVLALAEHPGELERIQKSPELLPAMIEEILRWTTPILHFCRNATEDTEVSGTGIRKGETLALFYPSGNRDSAHFRDPYTFRTDRTPNHHITFGFGGHTCLGAHLARMELTGLFERLLPWISEMEVLRVARDPAVVVHSWREMICRFALRDAPLSGFGRHVE